ncbi:MAG: hypothetical protein WDN48_13735 [Pseudolabrys sp.]
MARGMCCADVTNSHRSPGWVWPVLAEQRIFQGIARLRFKHHAIPRNAETVEYRINKIRFGKVVAAQAGVTTGINNARVGIGPRPASAFAMTRPASPTT